MGTEIHTDGMGNCPDNYIINLFSGHGFCHIIFIIF